MRSTRCSVKLQTTAKMKNILSILILLVTLTLSGFADTPSLFRGDFTSPNSNVLARTGDLYTGLTLGQLWIKTAGYSNTGWVQVVVNSSIGTSSANPMGYVTGAGGSITQITSITTPVTLNRPTGQITTVASTLAAGVGTSFVVNDSLVNATDTPILSVNYAGTGLPIASVTNVTTGQFTVVLYNGHATAAFNGALIINFSVIHGSSN